MDLNETFANAFDAARRGDVDRLEAELVLLRALPDESVVGLDTRLRSIARSVRCHPSFADQAIGGQARAQAV